MRLHLLEKTCSEAGGEELVPTVVAPSLWTCLLSMTCQVSLLAIWVDEDYLCTLLECKVVLKGSCC